MELIYGTGNAAKLQVMKRCLKELPFELIGLKEAAQMANIPIPYIEENGNTPLENASLKAHAYYQCFQKPVFSCDSGLYLWEGKSGKMLPDEEQPGLHIRGRDGKRYTDDELISHYVGLVKKYGEIHARYKNGICLIFDEEHVWESMDESLWGDPFLLAKKPHEKRIEGFPLDSISIEISSGKYYYDLPDNSQDDVAAEVGFKDFFTKIYEKKCFAR